MFFSAIKKLIASRIYMYIVFPLKRSSSYEDSLIKAVQNLTENLFYLKAISANFVCLICANVNVIDYRTFIDILLMRASLSPCDHSLFMDFQSLSGPPTASTGSWQPF